MTLTLDQLAGAVGAVRSGASLMAPCPAHDDGKASLSLSEGANGRVLWHCHAGCSQGDVRAALERAGHLTRRSTPTPRPADRVPRRVVATYRYRDALGVVAHETLRYDPKGFGQRAPDANAPGGWVWSLTGVGLVPYRLPELLATPPDSPVVYTEGEKDADAVAALGIPATTVAMGAGKWRGEYDAVFRGRRVVIVPDNDPPGLRGAEAVARRLQAAGARVALLALPGLPVKGDASDWIAAGGTADALRALIAGVTWGVPDEAVPVGAVEDADPWNVTDLGNAERFHHKYRRVVRWVSEWGAWIHWRGDGWSRDPDGTVNRLAFSCVRAIYDSASASVSPTMSGERRVELVKHAAKSEASPRLAAVLDLAKSMLGVTCSVEALDRDPWLLNVANGTVDLRTGDLLPHNPADLITRIVRHDGRPAVYDPLSTPATPVWNRFLETVLPDPEVRGFVQRAVGYSITGSTRARVLFVLHGTGRNGKGVFCESVLRAIGEYGLTISADLLLAKKITDGATPGLASLNGARFVVSSETPAGGKLDEARIKSLTGDDRMTARRLYEGPITWEPTHTLWLSTNHRPVVTTGGEALWDRLNLVPFTVRIPDADVDPLLRDKLKGELGGILAWAVEGSYQWHRDGLCPPAAVRAATAAYEVDSDWFGEFVNDSLVEQAHATTSSADLIAAYSAWAAANAERPLTATALGTQLRERGFERFTLPNGRRAWRGVGIQGSVK